MRKIVFLRFLPLLFLAACAGVTDENPDASEQAVSFSIIPSIGEAGNESLIATRAKVSMPFASGTQVGLGIAGNDIKSIYTNFFARHNGTDWLYYLGGINNGTLLSGFRSWGSIDIYGYYPYNSAVTNLAQVPFRIASAPDLTGVSTADDNLTQVDYLVAGTVPKDMTGAIDAPVSLVFGHLMTSIEFNVRRLSYTNLPIIKLAEVVYEISTPRSFGVAGTYTAINPVMTNMSSNLNITEQANLLEVTYPNSATITSTSYTNRLLIILPELRYIPGTVGMEDATVKLTFFFEDQDGSPYVFDSGDQSVSFLLSSIDNGTGIDAGLLAGYTYMIQASVGTYTKFTAPSGPTVVDSELESDTDPVFIEI